MKTGTLAVILVGFSIVSGAQEKQATQKPSPKAAAVGAHLAERVPAGCPSASAAPQFEISPGGTVVVTRSDGNQETSRPQNISSPRRDCGKCDGAVVNSPPALPEVNNWLGNHAQVLLNAIQSIAGPDQTNNELQWERGDDIYGVVAKRTETLRRLAVYLKNR